MRLFVFLLVASLLAACGPGDGTGGTDPNGNGNGTTTLSGDVQPIFTNNCAFSGCHGGATPQLGQHLGAGQTWGSVVNVPSQELPGMMRVRPGQPDSSYLVHKLRGTHLAVGGSGERMPLGASPLSAADRATIEAWITAGAPNN